MTPQQRLMVIRDLKIPPSPKLILFCLAGRADVKNECWPSLLLLAKDSGLGRATIARWLPSLRDAGLLQITKPPGKSNRFKLTLDPSHHETTPVSPRDPKRYKKSACRKFIPDKTCWNCRERPPFDTALDRGLCLACHRERNPKRRTAE